MRRQRQKPRVLFKRLHPTAFQPEVFPETEASFTLFAPESITAADWIRQVSTRLSITLPTNYIAIVQQHPFAMSKGLLVFATQPITSFSDGAIQLSVVNLARAAAPVRPSDKGIILIPRGGPLAILTVVRAPWVHGDFHGFDSSEESPQP